MSVVKTVVCLANSRKLSGRCVANLAHRDGVLERWRSMMFFCASPQAVPIGSTAPQAAGVIHTDFERGFIRAETIAFDDFLRYKGESGARDAGKLRLEGKEYLVKEGDVLHFRFNV